MARCKCEANVTITISTIDPILPKTQNLLHGCLSLGFNLPYFCWHPALGSVGACRQCAVKQFKDEHDTHGKIVMACMTPPPKAPASRFEDPGGAPTSAPALSNG